MQPYSSNKLLELDAAPYLLAFVPKDIEVGVGHVQKCLSENSDLIISFTETITSWNLTIVSDFICQSFSFEQSFSKIVMSVNLNRYNTYSLNVLISRLTCSKLIVH